MNKTSTLCQCKGRATVLRIMFGGRGFHNEDEGDQSMVAEHFATGARKLWNTLWSMGVFTQLASNSKGFARKCASASCVNWA